MKLDSRIHNILSEQDEKRHSELRAKMMPGVRHDVNLPPELTNIRQYTAKEVPDLEATVDDRVFDLIDLITREGVEKRSPVDFAQCAQYFTLDSLTHLGKIEPAYNECQDMETHILRP